MTGAALQGDDAALGEMLPSGAAEINASAIVERPRSLCPGEPVLTPLQAASCAGHANIVKKLLKYKADPNLPTSTGKTPLFLALNRGNEDVVRLLVRGGARPNAVDAGGDTALMIAAQQGNRALVDFLLKNGASAQGKNRNGETALMLASDVRIANRLIALGCDPLERNNNGDSALHIAARNGNAEMAGFFLERGVRVDLRNRNRETALRLARAGHHGPVAALLEGKLRQAMDKELAAGNRAAEGHQLDEALSLYSSAASEAEDLGGAAARNVRVKIIKSVNAWPNPPALSAKARKHLVRSAYILKNNLDLHLAEKEIAEALQADPWWLKGYYNLGFLQAKLGEFDRAARNLAVFVAAAPPGPKAQSAQDKIYELGIAKEEAAKVRGVAGRWTDGSGNAYKVAIDGDKLRIVSRYGRTFDLTLHNHVIKGSVEGKAKPGPHQCTLPGQIHPVNGTLDSNAKGISLDYLWSSYDTRFHCVNMVGVPTVNCCLTCDEVCDAVNIVATNSVRLRLVRAK